MVLLIVLLILMMTTATATFAVHSTGYEIQAAGSMRQALRTRNVSEGMANTMMLFARDGTRVCEFEKNVASEAGAGFSINVAKYGYPDVVVDSIDESVANFDLFTIAQADPGFENTPIPDDSDLSSSALASTYTPTARAMVECTRLGGQPMPGEESGSSASGPKLESYRVRATLFGEMASALDSNTTGALRADHETVSISRVYLNL